MKTSATDLPPGPNLRQRLSVLLTLSILTLLIGSLIVVISVAHRASSGPARSSSVHTVSLGVYFGAGDGSLVKLDASSGHFLWRFHTQGRTIPAPPAVAAGIAYVGSTDGHLHALRASDGSQLWSFATGATILGSPVVADGVVYVGSDDSSLWALDAKSGTQRWRAHLGTSSQTVNVNSPTVDAGVVYATASDNVAHSYVVALAAASGITHWSKQLTGQQLSSPQVAEGKVYVTATAISSSGGQPASQLLVFNASDGSQPSVTQQHVLGQVSVAPPTVSGGVVYYGSKTGLVTAVNTANGALLWQAQVPGAVNAAPVVAPGLVVVGVSDATITGNAVMALNASTGSVVWRQPVKNYTGTNLVVDQGVLYLGAADGVIYALKLSTGAALWTYQDAIPFGNTPITVAP